MSSLLAGNGTALALWRKLNSFAPEPMLIKDIKMIENSKA
jgi:hypothetical protein